MRKLIPLLLIPVVALVFSSCGKEEPDYKIIGEGSIPLIGDDGNGRQIYVHDLSTGETEVFRGLPAVKPILITGTGDGGRYYFVSGSGYNTAEGYFDNITVHFHHVNGTREILTSPKVSKIYSNILDANTLNLVLYHLELVNQRVYKDNYMIDSTGRIVTKQKETYNLMEGQIPEVPAIRINNTSPDGQNSLTIENSDKKKKIIITGAKAPKGKLILETEQNVDRVFWTQDKEKVILLTSNLDVHKTDSDTSSTLLVYSMITMDYLARFSGSGYRTFTVKNSQLAFDDIENEKRFVRIFDLEKLKEARRIKMKNGVSIRFLPYN